MFDKHIHVQGSAYPQSVTVHEHRAPTDQSVRLLNEMEQAAREKVVQSVRLENSPIDCVIHTQREHVSADIQVLALVKINGRRLEIRKTFHELTSSTEKIAEGMVQAVGERIAAELLCEAFSKLPAHLRF